MQNSVGKQHQECYQQIPSMMQMMSSAKQQHEVFISVSGIYFRSWDDGPTRNMSLEDNHISPPLLYVHNENKISRATTSECFWLRKTPKKYKYAKKNLNVIFQVIHVHA